MSDFSLPVLNGDCGISSVPSFYQIALTRIPTRCCPEGCYMMVYSGTKVLDDSGVYVTPFAIVGDIPGVLVANLVQSGDAGGGEYFFAMGCFVTEGVSDPLAFGSGLVVITQAEHEAPEWEISVSWCLDGTFRVSYQSGDFPVHVFEVNLSDFVDPPFEFGQAGFMLFPVAFGEGDFPVAILEHVIGGCGSLPSGGDSIVLTADGFGG